MILKIGGGILSDIDQLEYAAQKIVEYINFSNEVPIVVVSAFKGETDKLIKMSKRFGNIPSSFVITAGEQITAGLFAQALEKYGALTNIKAKALAGWQVPIVLDKQYEDGVFINTEKLEKFCANKIVSIVTGFQGVDMNGDIVDLGRGGSDLTAICIAKALKKPCLLLKKSGGICAVDPDLVPEAFIWEEVSYDNLLYLVQSGSVVLQTDAAAVAKAHYVPMQVIDINFKTSTKISKNNKNFWSIFAYNHKLRIVTNKTNHQILSQYGFDFKEEEGFYEFKNQFFDIKKEAYNIYNICKNYL